MPELWLIRHAESLGNVDGTQGDTGLSPTGEEQVESLRQRLLGFEFDLVLASPLVRARQTAELALPDCEIVIEAKLRELVVPKEEFVDLSRLGADGLRELLAQTDTVEEHETGMQFIGRVREWLESLPPDKSTAAFSHFAVIRECLRQLVPGPAPQTIEHCSVHRISLPL